MDVINTTLGAIPLLSKIRNHLWRSKLLICCDVKYSHAFDISTNKEGNFFHLIIKTTGRSDAKNCMGTLISVEEQKNRDGKFCPHIGFTSPVKLKWAHEKDWSSKDIPPKTSIPLDLCYVLEGDPSLHFFTEKFPRGLQTDFPQGNYRAKVRVTGDNVKPDVKEFLFRWGSDWKNLKIEEYTT